MLLLANTPSLADKLKNDMDETEKDMLDNAYSERKIASSNEVKRKIKDLVNAKEQGITFSNQRNIPTMQP